MKRLLEAFFALVVAAAAFAQTSFLQEPMKGVLLVDQQLLTISMWDAGFASIRGATLAKEGKLTTNITPLPDGSCDFTARFHSDTPVTSKGLALFLTLPLTTPIPSCDGKLIQIPADYEQKFNLYDNEHAKRFTVQLPSGAELVVSGDFDLRLRDSRKFNNNDISCRFHFRPSAGDLTDAELKLNFALQFKRSFPVDLAGVANAGYADEVAEDGKGGWTDQGPNNDLRSFQPVVLRAGGIQFHPLDPNKNQGRSCIVLGRTWKATKSPVIPVKQSGEYLYLLHANGWHKPTGRHCQIHVAYQDGSTQSIPLESNQDIANWWGPMVHSNAIPIWESQNSHGSIGLFYSKFKLENKPISTLQFELDDPETQWMVVAATLSPDDQNLSAISKAFYYVPGKEWAELDAPQAIQKDSPLDFSGMLDAPAGKHGWLKVGEDGHFFFEKQPGKPVRFIGTNLCFKANYLSHEQAEQLAERLERIGYNAVRFHHQDGPMVKKAKGSVIDPVNLDRLEYLFYALKKRGIYILTDVYVSRSLSPDDNIPEVPEGGGQPVFKGLYPISQTVRDNWKAFARNWLGHKNPYTNMTWLEDPALYSISLVNEDNLYAWWQRDPKVRAIYVKKFSEWMAQKYPTEKVGALDYISNRRFFEFLWSLQDDAIQELATYLKKDLGYRGLYTDLNMANHVPLALSRDKMDIVDDHKYQDHPSFPIIPWRPPQKYRQESSISHLGWEVPNKLLPARLYGKPFSITEYKFCFNNRFRSEGGPVIGAYAALQDWDALHQFAFSHSDVFLFKDGPSGTFDATTDPLSQLTDRITMFLLRRKDVSTAPQTFAYRVPKDFWKTDSPVEYPEDFINLGLLARIGTVVGSKKCAATDLDMEQAKAQKPLANAQLEALRLELKKTGIARSITGEIVMDSKANTFTVAAPRAECAFLTAGALKAGRLSVAKANTPQSLTIVSLDGAPIASSRKLLAFHLTDNSNTNAKFLTSDYSLMEKFGRLPHLIRIAKLDVALQLEGSSSPIVQALKLDGTSYGTVSSKFQNGTLQFTANTNAFKGGVMLYLIERK
ncbi:MAG: hypothetical protein IJJ26_07095 [Victivallales bacterium]|nr:hypothetical protein [Victivallales bacterium]